MIVSKVEVVLQRGDKQQQTQKPLRYTEGVSIVYLRWITSSSRNAS